MVGYYCEAVRDLDDNLRAIEGGADNVQELLNSTPALVAKDKEAFGIVDENNNLLATVTAYVSKGAVSTVTVDSLVAESLNSATASNARLRVVGLELAPTGEVQFRGGTSLAMLSSQDLLKSLKGQMAFATQSQVSPMDVGQSVSKTVVLNELEHWRVS
jgi:hypothetical protein